VTADKIGAGAVTAVAFNADVAGDGIGLNAETNAIEVKVDDATIEISSDMLQVKAGGVDTAHLADDAVTSDKIADGAVTTDKLADSAALVALIGAGLGVVKTVAHGTEGSPITLLTADDAARPAWSSPWSARRSPTARGSRSRTKMQRPSSASLLARRETSWWAPAPWQRTRRSRSQSPAGGTSAAGEVTVFVIAIRRRDQMAKGRVKPRPPQG